MTRLELDRERFLAAVHPARPNDWEVDEVFSHLERLGSKDRERLLAHVPAIWPVSHSLCFEFLNCGDQLLAEVPSELLPEWVRQLLGIYEKSGLLGARTYMENIERCFLGPLRGRQGVGLDDIAPLMTRYLRGVSGRDFDLRAGPSPATDTRTIYLPGYLDLFAARKDNRLFYKLLISMQWAHVAMRLYEEQCFIPGGGDGYFDRFDDRSLAHDLFGLLQCQRGMLFLSRHLPGLVRQTTHLCQSLLSQLAAPGNGRVCRYRVIYDHLHRIFAGNGGNGGHPSATPADSLAVMLAEHERLYGQLVRLKGGYQLGEIGLLVGTFSFEQASLIIEERRQRMKDNFVSLLSSLHEQQTGDNENPSANSGRENEKAQTLLSLMAGESDADRLSIVLDNEGLELPEELLELAGEIIDDLGNIPEGYVQAAVGRSGGGVQREGGSPGEQDQLPEQSAAVQFTYDEWDYRRGGYRQNWCVLMERHLHPVRSDFVAATLLKYQAELVRLRRQFEMLRTSSQFVRRQRDGDEIDLDAMMDLLGDLRAGLPPEDRLFVRLLRNYRDITTLFLIDMSNSTEGWVGVAVKEALVLLAESLEVVGDSYGIYGFSGMRRSRNDLYCIKDVAESYSDEVQRRIAAIGPKEYTRMGPPIRHLTGKLLQSQSKVRLLLVISDGKPEDYDDYKGQYAIEDTKKALLEAKGKGIYTFCITIDKDAHDYLGHMFGSGNYIFVDRVASLPARMSEMYRLLTS